MWSFMQDDDDEFHGGCHAEYASSGRATCKLCRIKINNKSLRVSKMADGPYGETPHWYHMPCFFKIKKHRPKTFSAISGVSSLKREDQEKMRKAYGKNPGGHCVVKFDSNCKQNLFSQTRLLRVPLLLLLWSARSDPKQRNFS